MGFPTGFQDELATVDVATGFHPDPYDETVDVETGCQEEELATGCQDEALGTDCQDDDEL